MHAKKSLGQHFLKSERALVTIVSAGEVNGEDTILEIGPGTGSLTEKLLETGAKVIAVEKDDQLFVLLKQQFAKEISSGQLILMHDDILEFDLSQITDSKYKLIANIPYNITGAIFKKFLETKNQPEKIVLLVQKEVAKRIVAQDQKESILSISVKVYGAPKYVETVKAGSFAPMPAVDSAIIVIEGISKKFFEFGENEFFQMLREGFKAKRKKLSSNLAGIFDKKQILETFQKLNLDENVRAEDLNIETWQKLGQNLIK